MKLIYVTCARIPTEKAHGAQIMKMCEAFSSNGVDVELVIPNRKTQILEDEFDYYAVKKNFKIKKLWTLDLVGDIPRAGFLMGSTIFSLLSLSYLKDKKADIIYTRDIISAYFLSFQKKPFYWESHVRTSSWAARRVIRHAQGLIVITHGLKDFYMKMGVSKTDILVEPSAVDLEEFRESITQAEARQALGLPLDKKIAMYIGLLDAWKGYRTLLEASKFLPGDVSVVVVGGYTNQIKNLRREFPDVMFTGMRPYKELSSHQQAADVLVIPNSGKSSVSVSDTSPLKLFAYMTSGKPIVASDLPSLCEILSHNENAFLVDPDDAKDLAIGIVKVLEDPALARRISEKALKDVQAHTWGKRAQRIVEFIS